MSNKTCSRLWAAENGCEDVPIAFALIYCVIAVWVGLFVIAGLRLIKMSRSSPIDTAVAKKMQFLQAWVYSLFFTLVELAALFAIIALLEEAESFEAAIFLGFFSILSLLMASQIDVIGTQGRNQGVNAVDFSVVLQYLSTIYLPKAVWKLSGHREHGVDIVHGKEDVEQPSTKFNCLTSNVDNSFTPRVYDFKDIVGIQGAFLGLPGLFVLLLDAVRSGYNTTSEASLDPSSFVVFAIMSLFFSAIMAPLLGDWETHQKNAKMCIGSMILRFFEIAARLSLYAFLLDATKYAGLILFAAEFAAMWLTNVEVAASSSAGRVHSGAHKLLASWEAVFFSFYRRVHVDKEFSSVNLSLMPFTIEFVRFLVRSVASMIGYFVVLGNGKFSKYADNEKETSALPGIFAAGFIANLVVIVFHLGNFLIVNRSKLSWSEFATIKSYWMTLKPCKAVFGSKTVHLNRDNDNFHAGQPPHYI